MPVAPGIFVFEGPDPQVVVGQISETNYVIYKVLLLSYMTAFTNTISSSAKLYKLLNSLVLCMVTGLGNGLLCVFCLALTSSHANPTNCTG